MLYLLTTPAWQCEGAAPQRLPATVPGALLVVLAVSKGWVSREQLALIFWPDSGPSDALHHLRVNLHRARALLASWGQAQGLQAERHRVRLVLCCDVARWHAAMAGDAPLPEPAHWLLDWRLSGYAGFAQWCDATAQRLHQVWLVRSRRLGPGSSGAAAPPPGRQVEHQRLLASQATALLLLGEPGIGKTTLLMAAYPQAPCLYGLEGLQGMPYRPLLDLLRTRLPALQSALRDERGRLRPYRLDLARMLPELAPDEPLPALDALTAQSRLVEALVRAFEALTPVLLVDDLQWCDAATVEWLLLLAHSGRLRWRAGVRQHEIDPALAQALRPLSQAGHLEELLLGPLPRELLPEVCQARWPNTAFGTEELNQLHALSAGNPFVLGELVAAGAAVFDPRLGLPRPVREWLQRRLAALPELAQRAVQAAAVFVQAVPDAALRALAGVPEVDDGAWAAACNRALQAGLLRRQQAGLACGHDLIRAATAAQITGAQRAALHRHAALWLAERPGADAMTIAAHWRAAGDPQTALAWCQRGAEQLKARGRFDEARVLWCEVADDSVEVLIELAMREPDISAAWALLAQLRLAAPRRPTVLSFEGQIHWFSGQVQAAHDTLARLLVRHPDYCCGITIENDLAVMLHALGDMTQAETMARRSLISWAGVAHTETLSLLVLGSVLTSAGRPDEADAALRRALALAQGQSSAGFEAEARVRRARGLLQAGRVPDAVAELAAARPLLAASTEPLRVSQWVLVSVIAAQAQGQAPGAELLARLGDVGARSTHPLVHARAAQVRALVALAAGDAHAALAATDCQAALARAGGLQELRAEAALLAARAFQLAGRPAAELRACVAEVTALAAQQGLGDILRRVEAWLGTVVDAETVEG